MRERLDPDMDTISEERIDKRVIKHDKNMVSTVFDSFKQSSFDFSTLSWNQMLCLGT